MTDCTFLLKKLTISSILLLVGLFLLSLLDINGITKAFLGWILFALTINNILPYFKCIDNNNKYKKR